MEKFLSNEGKLRIGEKMKKITIVLICFLILSVGSIEKKELYTTNGKQIVEITMDKQHDLTFVLDVETGKGYIDGAYDLGIDITKYNQRGVFYICSDDSYVYVVSNVDLKNVIGGTMPTTMIDAEFLTTEKKNFLNANVTVSKEIKELKELSIESNISKQINIKVDATFLYEDSVDIKNLTATIKKENNTLIIDTTGTVAAKVPGLELMTVSMLETVLKSQYNLDVTIHEFAYTNNGISFDASVTMKKEDLEGYGDLLAILHDGLIEMGKEGKYYTLTTDLTLESEAPKKIATYIEQYTEGETSYEEYITRLEAIKESGAVWSSKVKVDCKDTIQGDVEMEFQDFDSYYRKAREMGVNVRLNKGKIDAEINNNVKSDIAVKYESQSTIEVAGEVKEKLYIKGNLDLATKDIKSLKDAGITYVAFDGRKLYIEFEDIEKIKKIPFIDLPFLQEPTKIDHFEHMEIKQVRVEKPSGIDDELEYLGFGKDRTLLIVGALIVLIVVGSIAALYLLKRKGKEEKYCEYCGFKLKEGAEECPNCGKKV